MTFDIAVCPIPENVLVAFFAVIMALSYQMFPLSKASYTRISIFKNKHEIGAHCTNDHFLMDSFGFSLNDYLG